MELEGILAWLIIAVPLEPSGSAAVGNDVEEPQNLAVEPPAGGDDAGEEFITAPRKKCDNAPLPCEFLIAINARLWRA